MDADGVIAIVRSHGIPIDAAIIQAAFAGCEDQASLQEWAALHLTRDTLLSRDEQEQYAALQAAGVLEELASSVHLSTVGPLSENELKNAVSELNQSTEAVKKQSEVMRQQQEALARLKREAAESGDARAALQERQRQKWERDRDMAVAQLAAVSQRLELKVTELEPKAKGPAEAVAPLINDVLRSDDRLLTSLQKLGHELPVTDPEEEEQIARLREVCARLIKDDVETIRTKLDRTYLEALRPTESAGGAAETVSGDDASALEEEVESLYAEILPVAQMCVQQQFLDPALRSVSKSNGLDRVHSDRAFAYIIACLDYLLDRMQRLTTRTRTFSAHHQATDEVVRTAREQLAVQVDPADAKRGKPPQSGPPSSPTRRRKSSGQTGAGSPVRLRATLGRRRSSGGGGLSDEPPLDQLLRSLAIALPASDDPLMTLAPGESPVQAQVAALETSVSERNKKLADIARNTQDSFESATSAQLADGRRSIMLVRHSILAESPFSRVCLADPAIEASIEFLAQEVQALQRRLDSLPDGSQAKESAAKKELVRRWGK